MDPSMFKDERNPQFSVGLFDCFKANCCTCCCNFLFCWGPCTNGSILAQLKPPNNCCLYCFKDMCCCYACNRRDIREAFGIEGSLCNDCLITTLCYPCAAVQNSNEFQIRATKAIFGGTNGLANAMLGNNFQ